MPRRPPPITVAEAMLAVDNAYSVVMLLLRRHLGQDTRLVLQLLRSDLVKLRNRYYRSGSSP